MKNVGMIILLLVLLIIALAIVGYTKRCPGVEQGDMLRTDRECYRPGESVVFTFRNTWDHSITYDTELRDTLVIYDPNENVVVMEPLMQTYGLLTLDPNETLEWTWDQTYYLWEENGQGITWDDRTGSRVSPGKYTAKIEFSSIQAEASFWIIG